MVWSRLRSSQKTILYAQFRFTSMCFMKAVLILRSCNLIVSFGKVNQQVCEAFLLSHLLRVFYLFIERRLRENHISLVDLKIFIGLKILRQQNRLQTHNEIFYFSTFQLTPKQMRHVEANRLCKQHKWHPLVVSVMSNLIAWQHRTDAGMWNRMLGQHSFVQVTYLFQNSIRRKS